MTPQGVTPQWLFGNGNSLELCDRSGGETPGAKRNPRISSRPSGITCRFEALKSHVGLLSVTGRMDPVTESSKYKMLKVFQTFGMSTNTDQVDGVHS